MEFESVLIMRALRGCDVFDKSLCMQAVCTVVALLACIPLGELFFFHLILIKKVSWAETFQLVNPSLPIPHSTFSYCKECDLNW